MKIMTNPKLSSLFLLKKGYKMSIGSMSSLKILGLGNFFGHSQNTQVVKELWVYLELWKSNDWADFFKNQIYNVTMPL